MSVRTENPLQSLYNCVVTSSADWSSERDRAWVYAVVCGWDPDPEDPDPDPEEAECLEGLAARWNWDKEDVARIRRLHAKFEQLREGR